VGSDMFIRHSKWLVLLARLSVVCAPAGAKVRNALRR
jgi:hypothetical protein